MGQGGGITVLIRSWTSGVMWLNFGVLVLPSENACSDSWNPGKQCTSWLNEGEGLFDGNTFVQKFLVRATHSHHSSCQISVPEFFLAFQRDSGATAKKTHERAILIVRFVFEKGRFDVVDSEWLQLQLASQCKHMAHSTQVSPGISSVGRRVTLLQER